MSFSLPAAPAVLKPGHRLELEIDRLSLGGEAVGRVQGVVVFVPYGAPGERLEVEVTEARSRFARARLLKVLRPSRSRVAPPCPYHFQAASVYRPACGGCSWQHLDYGAQLRAKRDLVQETLERLGGLRDFQVRPVLGMQDPWRYRNKVQEPVGWDGRRLISGFYSAGSHAIVPVEECRVQPPLSVAIVNQARELLNRFGARAYDAPQARGWIRHLWVRTSSEGKALLAFVTRTLDFPHERPIVETLLQNFPSIVGLHQNVNSARTNVVLGRQWRTLAGSPFLEESLGHLRFRLSPASFFQVNSPQAEVLYQSVARMAGRGERLLDLYSGVGTIALWLAGQFREVGGIEEVPAAVENAQANAALNGIGNVRFQAGSAEYFLKHLDRGAGGSSLTVTLDPPRAGCEADVIAGLLRLRPRTVVYVSCDPGTLARDLGLLVRGGYRVRDVQPVDLFPHTPHIETAVHLTGGSHGV